MNRHQFPRAAILGATLASTFALSDTSHAQMALDKNPLVNAANVIDLGPDNQTAQIRLLNMNAELAAYWLDPSHQPRPIQLQSSDANGGINPFERDDLPRQPATATGHSI